MKTEKKKYLMRTTMLLLLMMFTGISAWAQADLVITTIEEWRTFVSNVNDGNDYSGKTVELDANLDFSGVSISNDATANSYMVGSSNKAFKGTFNGKGYKISNFIMSSSALPSYCGFFRTNQGTIKNVVFENCIMRADTYGGIVASNNNSGGRIENCTVSGMVIANETTTGSSGGFGGITSHNYNGHIDKCTVKVTIRANNDIHGFICAQEDISTGTVTNSYYTDDSQVTSVDGNTMKTPGVTKGSPVYKFIAGSGISSLTPTTTPVCTFGTNKYYMEGTEVTFTAVVESGKTADPIFCNGTAVSKTNGSYTYTVTTEDVTVQTAESLPTHTVTCASVSGGTMTANPSSAHAYQEITLTATPASGYLLNGLTATDGTNPVSVSYQPWYKQVNTASFRMPDADVTVTPTFTAINNTSNEFSINLPKTDSETGTIPEGMVSIKVYDCGGASGNYGTNCNGSITLTAPTGYGFMVEGTLVVPSFHAKLNVSNENGAVLTDVCSNGYTWETSTAIINPTISIGNTLTISFTSDNNENNNSNQYVGLDLTVTMVNLTTPRAITLVQSAGGTVTTDKTTAVPNEVVTLTVTPRSGYNMLTAPIVTDDNGHNISVTDAGNGQYTFTMPITDVTVTLLTAEQGWTFAGTYKTQNFTAADTKYYGFVGTAAGGKEVGEFVRVGGYVRVKPMRAYLVAPGGTPKAAPARRTGEDIPSTLRVRLLGSDGETTEIISIDNGQLTIDYYPDAWYSLDGRKLQGEPTQKGVYINGGRKVVIK